MGKMGFWHYKRPKKDPWDGTKKGGHERGLNWWKALNCGVTSAEKWQMGKTGFLALQAPTYSSPEYKKWFFWNCNKQFKDMELDMKLEIQCHSSDWRRK